MSSEYLYSCQYCNGARCSNPECPVNGKTCPIESFAHPFPWPDDNSYRGLCKYEALVVDWKKISWGDLSDDFIIKNKDKLDWEILCRSKHRRLSENVLDVCFNYVDWTKASSTQRMSEEFIRNHADRFNAMENSASIWSEISLNSDISEAFFRTIINKCEPNVVNRVVHHRAMSYEFISEFSSQFDKADWREVSLAQPLTVELVREFANLVDWQNLYSNDSLSDDDLLALKSEDEWCEIMRGMFECFCYDGPREICRSFRESLPHNEY